MIGLPQPGIFALGTSAHEFLEFDLRPDVTMTSVVEVLGRLRMPSVAAGGVNLVVAFGSDLWRAVAPAEVPPDLASFRPLGLVGGHHAPATQHDVWLLLAGSTSDVVFEHARAAASAIEEVAVLATDRPAFVHRDSRDLTGFIDGSENPSLIEAPEFAVIPDGILGAGGTILLLQKWSHDADAWEALPVARQEQVIGRTKDESVELDDKPGDSHVARTDQDQFGKIFRRNMPYGTVSDHGTMFVGFSADQRPLATMLESMAGVADGVRDALTRYTQPLTGAYYFVPSTQSLRSLSDL